MFRWAYGLNAAATTVGLCSNHSVKFLSGRSSCTTTNTNTSLRPRPTPPPPHARRASSWCGRSSPRRWSQPATRHSTLTRSGSASVETTRGWTAGRCRATTHPPPLPGETARQLVSPGRMVRPKHAAAAYMEPSAAAPHHSAGLTPSETSGVRRICCGGALTRGSAVCALRYYLTF